MRGHLRQRGAQSWQLKIDIGKDANGKRLIEYHTFKGAKRAAQMKLAKLIAAIGKGAHVPRSTLSVGEHVAERIEQWVKLGAISAQTVRTVSFSVRQSNRATHWNDRAAGA